MAESEQEEVYAFLADPRNHGGQRVTRIDTHAASVFLAGDRAYKVKRTVKLPYLDYSTLEKRHQACRAELEVNRFFAPQLYLGVQSITKELNGDLRIGGVGTPVEYTVVMKRFDETQTLNHLAKETSISDDLADALAKAVTDAHAKTPRVDPRDWLRALPKYVEQSCDAFRRHPELFQEFDVGRFNDRCKAWLQKIEPIVLARAGRGLVRRGHGDLHLGNIALIEGKPLIFDAIEFDEIVASGDVFYDLGFLLMDLIEQRQERAANILLNRYLQYSHPADNIDGLDALPFYLSLRAAIRATVTVAKIEREGTEVEALSTSATNYFKHALDFLSPPPPKLLAIGGLSGTGKSVLAADIASSILPAPGAIVLRSDVTRKNMLNVGELDRLEEKFYGPEWNRRTYELLDKQAAAVLAAGHSVIVDAAFTRLEERRAIEKVATVMNTKFLGVFLMADIGTRLARIQKREDDASDATVEVALRQEAQKLDSIEWPKIDASASPETTLKRLQALLSHQAKA